MHLFIHIQINLFSIIMLLCILYRIHRSVEQHQENRIFQYITYVILAILLVDIVWVCVEGKGGMLNYILLTLCSIIHMPLTAVCGYFLLQFSRIKLNSKPTGSIFIEHYIHAPILILALLSISSPWTGLLFHIDQNNIYHRGSLFYLQYLIGCLYIFLNVYLIVQNIQQTRYVQHHHNERNLLLFCITPTICTIISFFVYGLPIIWPMTSLTLFLVYMDFQMHQISTDKLTGIGNRRHMDELLHKMIHSAHDNECIYLILLDVHGFTHINDIYGHCDGDIVLTETATMLNTVCSMRQQCVVARYSNDVFAIAYQCNSPNDLYQLKRSILTQLDIRNAKRKTPYDIKLSIGYAQYTPTSTNDTSQLIEDAYAALCKNKNNSRLKVTK